MSASSDTVAETPAAFDVDAVRARFSSLEGPLTFFDAPGGTQVPDEVGDAIARTLREASANLGAPYETSRRVGEILETAKERAARFLGCAPGEIAYGLNMTSLNFALSRTVGRGLQAGDEVLVTRLDHDANVAPWLELARDLGLEVRLVDVLDDLTLDYDDLARALSPRTRIVAFPWASNMVGTRVDVQRVCAMAHDAGALAWIDAVHAAAHETLDVRAVGADVAICSSYKFCGPHLGIAYVRAEVAQDWRPYKVRPHPDEPVARRLETGTSPFEALAGAIAAFDYLDSIGGMAAIKPYEQALARRFLDGLPEGVTVYGPRSLDERVPTFLLNVDGVPARDVATGLAERGYALWAHDTFYAVGLAERLPYDGEAIRVGLIHYNSADEVDRLLAELTAFAGRS